MKIDMNFSALEELSGDVRIFGKTWNFSKRSVETGKLQHSVVSLYIFIATSLAASCFSQQIHADIPKEDVGMKWAFYQCCTGH